ncbi:hypothetical protein TNIN_6731 [Trichonephila inaurata madagascariensis]|uniref:Uncharacterized protein n=1 Tax=Trichonephila inaurata madagascariensis TaxID=2747483 RepID=A0A8X6WNY2_9ARAC|nr:hypothetical protein TNIN_6731 [Trichonephila inaurata madagascariensis]
MSSVHGLEECKAFELVGSVARIDREQLHTVECQERDFVRPLTKFLLSVHWVWSSRSLARFHGNLTTLFSIPPSCPRTQAVNE